MITVITEYANLIMIGARLLAQGPQADTITTAVRAAIAETSTHLHTAVANIPDPLQRADADAALALIESTAAALSQLDGILGAAAFLPGDLDLDYETARLRSEREVVAAELSRNTTILTVALADARLDLGAPEAGSQLLVGDRITTDAWVLEIRENDPRSL